MLGDSGSSRIDTLVHDLVEHSARAGDIVQGAEAGAAMGELRKFMFERVYLGPAVRAEHERIVNVVQTRCSSTTSPTPSCCPIPRSGRRGTSRERVTDYLAGMTDRYCIRMYTDLQVPQAFAR